MENTAHFSGHAAKQDTASALESSASCCFEMTRSPRCLLTLTRLSSIPPSTALALCEPPGGRLRGRFHRFIIKVGGTLNDANNVVSVREELDPIVERPLVLVTQVSPLWRNVLRLCGGLPQGARGVLSGEDLSNKISGRSRGKVQGVEECVSGVAQSQSSLTIV